MNPLILIALGGQASDPSAFWIERRNPQAKSLFGVTYGNGVYCAVGASSYCITSTDLKTWTEQTTGLTTGRDIAYGNSLFVSVGSGIYTSPDGETWTQRVSAGDFRCVHWNGTYFIVAGKDSGGNTYIAKSSDGISWTSKAVSGTEQINDIEWNGSIWVAVADADATDSNKNTWTSPDGDTWTHRNAGANSPLNDIDTIAVNGSTFIIKTTTVPDWYTSPDGINWTDENATPINPVAPVVFANGYYYAVTSSIIVKSTDGTTWESLGDFTFTPTDLNRLEYLNSSVIVGVGAADATDGLLVTTTKISYP